jgi:hypothetical protein
MTREEHIEIHKELHRAFDELLADWISHTKELPSQHTIMELTKWAHEQTLNPTEYDTE